MIVQNNLSEGPLKEPDNLFDVKRENAKYILDAISIFRSLQDAGELVTNEGYDRKSFSILINHMKITELHLDLKKSRPMDLFVQQEKETRALLKQSSPELCDEYLAAYSEWIQNNLESESIAYDVSENILKATNGKQEYMSEYGKILFEAKKAEFNSLTAEKKLQYKQINPALSMDELETKVRLEDLEQEVHEKEYLSNLERRYQNTINLKEGKSLNSKDIAKLVRSVKFLIHPDRIQQHENYVKLSENEKKLLNTILYKLPGNNKNIDLESPSIINGCDLNTVEGLTSALALVQNILEHAGINDLKPLILIRGNTLIEKCQFLGNENRRLIRHIQVMRAQRDAYQSYISWIDDTLVPPREKEKKRLQSLLKTYEENCKMYEAELMSLFDSASNEDRERSSNG